MSVSSSRSVHEKKEDEEESGWTAYFEDFSNNNNNNREEEEEEDDDDDENSYRSSLISDAASCVAWKLTNKNLHHCHDHVAKTTMVPKPRKLNFSKKPRVKQISIDDSLEDTASSPVNSPKLSDFDDMNNRGHIHQPRDLDPMYSSLGKGGISSEGYYNSEMQQKERSLMDFNGGHQIQNDCTDLKRRGLCLVPLSMLVNYLG